MTIIDKAELIRDLGKAIDQSKQARSDLIALGWEPNADSIIMIDGKIEGLRSAIRIIERSASSQ